MGGSPASGANNMKTISHEEREAQKVASRKRDELDLATGKKTHEQLCQENLCVRLTGARIDFSKSTSRYW